LRRDRPATIAWIDSLPEGFDRESLRSEYVSGLIMMKEPELAKSYALALSDGRERSRVIGQLASLLMNFKDTEGAVALVTNLPPSDLENIFAFDSFLRQWMQIDPQRASALLLEHAPAAVALYEKTHSTYKHQFSNLLDPWMKHDPAAATEFVLKLPEKARDDVLWASLSAWCGKDAAAAGQWAASLPPSATREEALRRVAQLWAQHEATQVTQWLDRLPAGAGKYAAAEGFASAVMSINADDALAWLRVNPDPADRATRLRRIWQSWRAKDAASAQRWRDSSAELTESERAALKSR
jgi:hypothetical protein